MTRPDTTRLVMKFGGTSMGDLERIRRAARIIAAEAAKGKQIAVVVSAMAETTTATFLPVAASAATMRAARRIRSRSPMEVPPNFITNRFVSARVILASDPLLAWRAKAVHASAHARF